jgi:hypothetical protein
MRGAIAGPFWAALPLAAIGFAAYLSGYPSDLWFVETAFAVLALAWPTAILVGVPWHLVLLRMGVTSAIARGVFGALLALGIAWLSPSSEASMLDDSLDWEATHWAMVAVYGFIAGVVFARVARVRTVKAD